MKRRKQIHAAIAIVDGIGMDVTRWTVAEIKTMIQWKNPTQTLAKRNRTELIDLWRSNEGKTPPSSGRWTAKDEWQLKKAETGDIGCIHDTTVMKEATQRTTAFLASKLKTLPKKELFTVMAQSLDELGVEDQQEFIGNWDRFTSGVDFGDDSSVSSLDLSVLDSVNDNEATNDGEGAEAGSDDIGDGHGIVTTEPQGTTNEEEWDSDQDSSESLGFVLMDDSTCDGGDTESIDDGRTLWDEDQPHEECSTTGADSSEREEANESVGQVLVQPQLSDQSLEQSGVRRSERVRKGTYKTR